MIEISNLGIQSLGFVWKSAFGVFSGCQEFEPQRHGDTKNTSAPHFDSVPQCLCGEMKVSFFDQYPSQEETERTEHFIPDLCSLRYLL